MNKLFFKWANKTSWAVFACAAIYTPMANASGYHFGTQSVSAQSTANASAAEAADASTIYYNPAGITQLEGTNISLSANLVAPSVEYSNAEGYYAAPPGQEQQAIAGSNSGKITEDIVAVPHIYATHQLDDQWTLGLGVYVPFASGTEYDRDSVLRYNVNKTEVMSIDINPTVGFKINDQHSVSVGLIGQYMSAEFRQYANWGRLVDPTTNGLADGFSEVEGDDWGFGYNFGYLWDVNDNVRLGVSYRSKIDHELKGSAEWKSDHPLYSTPAGSAALPAIQGPTAAGGAGYSAHEDASLKIVTPESLSAHGMFALDDQWTMFGDVTWTRHSRFNKANINFGEQKVVANAVEGGRAQSNTTTLKPNWEDTFRISLGGAYQYNDALQLRFGVAFDESPVPSTDYRLSTMPDSDRIWLSLGAKYDFSENSSLNFGYSYIHIKDSSANVNGWCGSMTPMGPGAKNCVSSRTDGSADYDSDAHILGIQYNHRF